MGVIQFKDEEVVILCVLCICILISLDNYRFFIFYLVPISEGKIGQRIVSALHMSVM